MSRLRATRGGGEQRDAPPSWRPREQSGPRRRRGSSLEPGRSWTLCGGVQPAQLGFVVAGEDRGAPFLGTGSSRCRPVRTFLAAVRSPEVHDLIAPEAHPRLLSVACVAQTRGNEERHFHRSIAGVRSELKPALTLHGAARLDRGARSPSRGERPCRGERVPVPSLVAATLDARATLARTGSRCLHRSSRDQA